MLQSAPTSSQSAQSTAQQLSNLIHWKHFVLGLSAKPIIDIMAAVTDMEIGQELAVQLEGHGYRLIETGMQNRLFLR